MILNPFANLDLFGKSLRVALFTREDDIVSDQEAARKIEATKAAGLNQAHGNRVIVVRDVTNRKEEADGMITDAADLALCIRWADCQNFVVYAPDHHVLGAMHVGWRCLREGTIPSYFKTLKEEFGIGPEECLVAGGPSLCMQCSEFSNPLEEIANIPPSFVAGKLVDLRGWAERQFTDAGVDAGNIEMHRDCTRCNPKTYWTYRGGDRDMVKTGHSNMLVCALKSI